MIHHIYMNYNMTVLGRMNMVQKNQAIMSFNEDAETTIFLISLKAGGIALNLTIASYCFLLDPWWNPAAEFQAADRIYRLGQFKVIFILHHLHISVYQRD
jgi:DNA repair protein RAD16